MKRKNLLTIGCCLTLTVCLLATGCGASGEPDGTADRPETESAVNGPEESQTQATETATETGTATETTQMDEASYAFLDSWISSLDYDEYKFCLWNPTTETGNILENDEVYKMEENDVLVLYKPEEFSSFTSPARSDFHFTIDQKDLYDIWNVSFENILAFSSKITSASGNDFEFHFTLCPPSYIPVEEGYDFYLCGPGNDAAIIGVMLPEGWCKRWEEMVHTDNLSEFLLLTTDLYYADVPWIGIFSEEACSEDVNTLLTISDLNLNVLESQKAAEVETPYGTAEIYYQKVEDSRRFNDMDCVEREVAMFPYNGLHLQIIYENPKNPYDGTYNGDIEAILPQLFHKP